MTSNTRGKTKSHHDTAIDHSTSSEDSTKAHGLPQPALVGKPVSTTRIEIDELQPPTETPVKEKPSTNDLRKQKFEQFKIEAAEGAQCFIDNILEKAIDEAFRLANVSLMCGIATSAIRPIAAQREEAIQWLTSYGGKHLAEFVKNHQSSFIKAEDTKDIIELASTLTNYINGKMSADSKRIEEAHPEAGQEVVQLLRSLGIPKLFNKALTDAPTRQYNALRLFNKILEDMVSRKFYDSALFNYTLQEVATHSFNILVEQIKTQTLQEMIRSEQKTIWSEFQKVHEQLALLQTKSTGYIIINTGGGTYVSGNVEVKGDFVGRDILQTSYSCAPTETAQSN